jgi:hypothetical protein
LFWAIYERHSSIAEVLLSIDDVWLESLSNKCSI